jgi:hypothetical protein
MKMGQSVPKHPHIKFRRRAITQKKRYDYLDTGKDKISITKISCLRQTVRNFITGLGRQTQCEKCTRKRREKCMGIKLNTIERRAA